MLRHHSLSNHKQDEIEAIDKRTSIKEFTEVKMITEIEKNQD